MVLIKKKCVCKKGSNIGCHTLLNRRKNRVSCDGNWQSSVNLTMTLRADSEGSAAHRTNGLLMMPTSLNSKYGIFMNFTYFHELPNSPTTHVLVTNLNPDLLI